STTYVCSLPLHDALPISTVQNLVTNGLPVRSLSFVALVFALGASIAIVLGLAAFLIYAACIRPGHLIHHTRYLITDRRVLIQRRSEEHTSELQSRENIVC